MKLKAYHLLLETALTTRPLSWNSPVGCPLSRVESVRSWEVTYTLPLYNIVLSIGATAIVRYREVIRWWEGPLWEVPPYVREKNPYVPVTSNIRGLFMYTRPIILSKETHCPLWVFLMYCLAHCTQERPIIRQHLYNIIIIMGPSYVPLMLMT